MPVEVTPAAQKDVFVPSAQGSRGAEWAATPRRQQLKGWKQATDGQTPKGYDRVLRAQERRDHDKGIWQRAKWSIASGQSSLPTSPASKAPG